MKTPRAKAGEEKEQRGGAQGPALEAAPSSLREEVFAYLKETYGALPEHLWARDPVSAVFRHQDNGKWFVLFMPVRADHLGLSGEEFIDLIDVKVPDGLLRDALLSRDGYLPGYHLNKQHWITVLLDGSVPLEEICGRIDESYVATASRKKKEELRGPREWLIPANPAYYDVEAAFEREKIIAWKQGKGIRTGDTVFMYVGAPVSAVLFRCLVHETGLPCDIRDAKVNLPALMNIELTATYPRDRFTLKVLTDRYGVRTVRGPRGVPASLSEDLALMG